MTDQTGPEGTPGEVFRAFLKLGLTSFGGPIAHLGYFRAELVVRRKWLSDQAYADLVALCQFLPGPASSQVGLAMGLMRGGWTGAAAAWAAFTLPSALLMIAFAYAGSAIDGPIGTGVIAGLKIVAVAIVAQAVWGMAQSLCPDRARATIAVGAVLVVVAMPGALAQVAAIAAGALAGLVLGGPAVALGSGRLRAPVSRGAGVVLLTAFAVLLFGLPFLAGTAQWLAVADAFYRAGALVFGGGHVILPLLQAEVVQPGWIPADVFLAGYGATQALPGPLFTFSAYLGALLEPGPNGLIGAALALVVLFLPGFLLLIGVLPFWEDFRARAGAQALMRGANAAVVGILGAALYDPVFTSAVTGPRDFALALVCFILLTVWKLPPLAVVLVAAAGGAALAVS
jgi:chromate transporter